MNLKLLVALSIVVVSGTAASQDLGTVVVRATDDISLACQDPSLPARIDVERMLHITNVTHTNAMRRKLMKAAAEGCKAGYEKIAVTPTYLGYPAFQGLSWTPVEGDKPIAGASESVKIRVLSASR